MNQAQDRFETRFEAILPTLATHSDVAAVRVELSNVHVKIANVQTEIAELSAKVGHVFARTESVEKDVRELRTSVDRLRDNVQRQHLDLSRWIIGLFASMFFSFAILMLTILRMPVNAALPSAGPPASAHQAPAQPPALMPSQSAR